MAGYDETDWLGVSTANEGLSLPPPQGLSVQSEPSGLSGTVMHSSLVQILEDSEGPDVSQVESIYDAIEDSVLSEFECLIITMNLVRGNFF
ncbi:hypothetical protein E4U31_004477 [Claviceps sp. LM219 group G6]|nr:hypothetical protein E4U31_004477 [Claviceps sp. LM219 group G6]